MNSLVLIKTLSLVALTLGVVGLFYLVLILGETGFKVSALIPGALLFLGGSASLVYITFFKK